MFTEDQFREVIEAYKDTVYKVAFSYLKNKPDTDDAFQEVFIRYLQKRPAFTSAEHEKAWLIRVTINVCKSALRSPWRKNASEPSEAFPSSESGFDELLDTILTLSPKYSTPLHLYYYEDYSVREIADIMKISETAVQTRLHRARQQLKTALTAAGQRISES